MKPLSKEETLRIFAMYLNCDLFFEPEYITINEKHRSNKKGRATLNTHMLNDFNDSIYQINSFKLILKPLTDLTSEQILELCKHVAPREFGDFRYSKWTITDDPKNGPFQNLKIIKNEHAEHSFEFDLIDGDIRLYELGDAGSQWTQITYRDWYFQNGFAVPLYPWNKNAIDLGIAVNANTIK